MDGYAPDETLAHRLDPRTKLAFQAAFAASAFAHTTPRGLAVLSALVLGTLALSETPLLASLRSYRALLPFLVGGPVIEALTLGPPWVVPMDAVGPALASYRVVLVLLVGTAYVRSTPVSDTRAAIQRLVPGRAGAFSGLGVSFVLRFLPVVRGDLVAVRDAETARLGDQRPVHRRIQLLGTAGLRRVFARADRFALALQARCFAWNPTLPPLAFGRADWVGTAATLALAATVFL